MSDVKPYPIALPFERDIVQLCCASRSFWGRFGDVLDPERLQDSANALVLRACKQIAKDTGRAPDMPSVVLQRIVRWDTEHRIKSADVLDAAEELITEVLPGTPKRLNEESVASELTPVLRAILETEAVDKAVDLQANNKDVGTVVELLKKANRVGIVDTAPGMILNSSAVSKIIQLKKLTRLGFGVPELDAELNGGMPRQCFGVVMGPAKSGKSQALCHLSANAMYLGQRVAYATMEISDVHIAARIIANLIDLPVDSIIEDLTASEASKRLENLASMGLLPYCAIKYFPPGVTCMQDIIDWVDKEEQACGAEIPVVCTDYVQLVGPGGDSKKEVAGHQAKKIVAEAHRAFAVARNKWVFSGAQPTRAKDKPGSSKTKIGLDDVADGMYITRTCDLAISLNPQEEGMIYHVAGFRYGDMSQNVGPFKTQFAYGRMSHVHRPNWPYFVRDDLPLLDG